MCIATAAPVAELRHQYGEKVKRGIFNPINRVLHEDAREDRLQEGIGLCWELYLKSAAKGVIMDDALLVHAARLRAQDLGRNVVRADGTQPLKDAYDVRNFIAGRVELYRLEFPDDMEMESPVKADPSIELGYAESFQLDPTEHLHSALDLIQWLQGLHEQDRQLLTMKASGYTLGEIGDELQWSVSAVFSRLKALGYELADRAEITIRRKPRKSRTPKAHT